MNSKAHTLKELQQEVDFTQNELDEARRDDTVTKEALEPLKEAARKAKEQLRIFSYKQHQSFTRSGHALRK